MRTVTGVCAAAAGEDKTRSNGRKDPNREERVPMPILISAPSGSGTGAVYELETNTGDCRGGRMITRPYVQKRSRHLSMAAGFTTVSGTLPFRIERILSAAIFCPASRDPGLFPMMCGVRLSLEGS